VPCSTEGEPTAGCLTAATVEMFGRFLYLEAVRLRFLNGLESLTGHAGARENPMMTRVFSRAAESRRLSGHENSRPVDGAAVPTWLNEGVLLEVPVLRAYWRCDYHLAQLAKIH